MYVYSNQICFPIFIELIRQEAGEAISLGMKKFFGETTFGQTMSVKEKIEVNKICQTSLVIIKNYIIQSWD